MALLRLGRGDDRRAVGACRLRGRRRREAAPRRTRRRGARPRLRRRRPVAERARKGARRTRARRRRSRAGGLRAVRAVRPRLLADGARARPQPAPLPRERLVAPTARRRRAPLLLHAVRRPVPAESRPPRERSRSAPACRAAEPTAGRGRGEVPRALPLVPGADGTPAPSPRVDRLRGRALRGLLRPLVPRARPAAAAARGSLGRPPPQASDAVADDVRGAAPPPARVVARRLTGGATAAAPCAVVMLLVVGLAWRERGSILPVDWGLYAIAAALLLLTVVVAGLPRRPSRLAAVGGIALLGLGIWAAVTATWSPVPESARDEALLTVLYAVAFAIGVCVGWTREAARTGVAVVAATSALLTLAVAVRVLRSGDVSGLYWDGRLATPISYPNALASVLVLGYWPGIGAATARSVHPLLRGCAGAVATATLSGWLMTQSKGAAIGLAVSGVVFFAVAPRRLAALIPTAITTVLVAALYGPLTRTFRASAGALTDAASTAATTTLVLTAVGGAAVAAFAYAESRTTVSPRTTRVAGVVVGAAAAIVAIAAIGAFLVRHDRPIAYVQHEWRAFKHQPAHEQGSSHLLTIGSNRYDTWRVALRDAQHHPIGGVGARGFSVSYPLHGRTQETPRRSHSVELDLLG